MKYKLVTGIVLTLLLASTLTTTFNITPFKATLTQPVPENEGIRVSSNITKPVFQKGMSYVSWPPNFDSANSNESLRRLSETNTEWVAICVFWYQDTLGSTEIHPDYNTPSNESVVHAIDRAHDLGMKVMLKPMVDPLSPQGAWRGQIPPSDAWFQSYGNFMNFWAEFSQENEVDMLCVGCEFNNNDGQTASWENITAGVRQRYSGPITYAANHDNYQNVHWWDSLDYVGIDTYFPLTNKNNPTVEELKQAWAGHADDIEAWQATVDKPVIFTELGYRSADGANKAPWDYSTPGTLDLQEQVDCYNATFQTFWSKSWFYGFYWWNWETNPYAGGTSDTGFTPQNKPVQSLITSWYARPKELLEHELDVSLQAPARLEPNGTSLLNATVYNRGLNNETVDLFLMINGTIFNSTTIPELVNGTLYTINYLWTPTLEAMYNVTAYAPPVPGENVTINNVAIKIVDVRPIKGCVLFDQTHGTDSTTSYSIWLADLNDRGYVVDTHTSGAITSTVLAGYDILVIPRAQGTYSPSELSAIQDFVLNGGGLLVLGASGPSLCTDLTGFAGIDWVTGGVSGVTTNITFNEVTEGVNSVYLGTPSLKMQVLAPAMDLVRDSAGGIMLAVSELVGRVIGFASGLALQDSNIVNEDNLRLANNMIDWLMGVRYEHELAVYLEAPRFIMPSISSLLNATVYNHGLNNETDVELQLMIDGNVVNSVVIPELVNGSSYSLSYLWAPTFLGTYNVTAYASPVSEENYTYNNRATRLVVVMYPLIHPMEGQWAEYTIVGRFGDYPFTAQWNFIYDHYVSPYLINVTMQFEDGYESTDWTVVNIMNRWAENGMFVGPWYIGWIETNITLGSTVNLMNGNATVVDSRIIKVGEHSIDCWELSQESGGMEYTYWYDKKTGLLISEEWIDSFSMKITLVATNIPIGTLPEPPLAYFTYSPSDPVIGETVTFNASTSEPGFNGTVNVPIANYTWDFGDGTPKVTETNPITTHNYTAAGTYTVNLTVMCQDDPVLIANNLTSNTTSQTITVEIHDVAVISVTPSPTEVTIGKNVTITVVVNNNGSAPENFTVTAYYDTTAIGTQTVINLAAGSNKTLTFKWNTADVEAGDYTIKAIAENVTGETNLANNEKIGGQVKVKAEPFPWLWITVGVVVVVIIIAAAYMLTRKKP